MKHEKKIMGVQGEKRKCLDILEYEDYRRTLRKSVILAMHRRDGARARLLCKVFSISLHGLQHTGGTGCAEGPPTCRLPESSQQKKGGK